MFKVIKRILIFIIAAFTALILFACVSNIVDPLTEEEQKAAEQQMQEMEEQSKLDKEQKEKEKEQKKKEKEAKKLAAQEKKDAEKAKREKEKIAKEKAKADAELKKKEQKEREKDSSKENNISEREKNKLVKKVDSLIPFVYKEKSTYDVYASTPTDKSIKGLFLNIQPVNSGFTDEEYCKYAAVEILENIKNVKDINKITFNFVDAYNIKYKLTIEDWETYKEKGIDEKTLKLTKVD